MVDRQAELRSRPPRVLDEAATLPPNRENPPN